MTTATLLNNLIYFGWKGNFRKFKKSSFSVQNLYLGWRWLILHDLSSRWAAQRPLLISTQVHSWWSVVLIEILFLSKSMTSVSMHCVCVCVCVWQAGSHTHFTDTYRFLPLCVCSCLFGWRCDLWLFDGEERELEERGEREGWRDG